MANGVYTAGIQRLITNGWSGQDPRVLLIDDSAGYVFDKDHDRLNDGISAAELNTTNYTPGSSRQALAGEAQNIDNTNDRVELDANDVTWTALGPSTGGPDVGAAIVYFHVDGNAANDIPFLYLDDEMPKVVNGEDWILQWNAEGIAQLLQP